MKPLTTVALASVLAIGTALVPSTAGAATHRDRDATRDVYAYSSAPDGVAVPDRSNGDIWFSKVRYRQQALVITMRMVTFEANVGQWSATYRIQNGQGERRRVDLIASPGEKTRVKMARLTGAGDYEAVRCSVARKVSYADDVIRVSIPSRCLERPRVVRVGLGLTGTDDNGNYLDDAQVDGSGTDEDVVFGPAIRRG